MPNRKILVLGGTRGARELAEALAEEGFEVVYSLAGVTRQPVLPSVETRHGGFGGVDGLARYLREHSIAAVADATHPFAAQMSTHAHLASTELGLRLFRLERPPWQPGPGDRWTFVPSAAAAAAELPSNARALVTIGRKEIGSFFARRDLSGIARMVEETSLSPPEGWTIILERAPFTAESEAELITHHAITHLVTKNAGGADTFAKLDAARNLSLPVVMITRPAKPNCPIFPDVKEIILAFRQTLLP